jgi:hypothetical protein
LERLRPRTREENRGRPSSILRSVALTYVSTVCLHRDVHRHANQVALDASCLSTASRPPSRTPCDIERTAPLRSTDIIPEFLQPETIDLVSCVSRCHATSQAGWPAFQLGLSNIAYVQARSSRIITPRRVPKLQRAPHIVLNSLVSMLGSTCANVCCTIGHAVSGLPSVACDNSGHSDALIIEDMYRWSSSGSDGRQP